MRRALLTRPGASPLTLRAGNEPLNGNGTTSLWNERLLIEFTNLAYTTGTVIREARINFTPGVAGNVMAFLASYTLDLDWFPIFQVVATTPQVAVSNGGGVATLPFTSPFTIPADQNGNGYAVGFHTTGTSNYVRITSSTGTTYRTNYSGGTTPPSVGSTFNYVSFANEAMSLGAWG